MMRVFLLVQRKVLVLMKKKSILRIFFFFVRFESFFFIIKKIKSTMKEKEEKESSKTKTTRRNKSVTNEGCIQVNKNCKLDFLFFIFLNIIERCCQRTRFQTLRRSVTTSVGILIISIRCIIVVVIIHI